MNQATSQIANRNELQGTEQNGRLLQSEGKGQGKNRLLQRFRYFELSIYTKIKRVDNFHTDGKH